MNNTLWKRFLICQNGLSIFFILNIFFSILNKKLSKPLIPIEITDYLFWLSLGLYLGFILCRHEYSTVMKKMK
jgi:hypothetical protein